MTTDVRWEHWLADLHLLGDLSFPRAVKTAVPVSVALHLFADASAEAYAAAAYVLAKYNEGEHSAVLAMARAHVKPPRVDTIPRLELLAAELSTQLRITLLQKLKLNVEEVTHWTDSLTVLYWINNDSSRLQAFVYNKIRSIRRNSAPAEWRWVPTHLNPADLPSRGIRLKKLLRSQLWQQGPDFLSDKAQWPVSPKPMPTSAVLLEMRKEEQAFLTVERNRALEPVFPFERFSSWQKCLRVLHHIAKWTLRHKKQEMACTSWKLAEVWALRQAQREDVLLWDKNPSLKHNNEAGWNRLRPFLAEDGLLRSRGRLSEIKALNRDAREPIILNRKHYATTLILRQIHEAAAHYGGTNYLLSRLQARFWVPKGRVLVKYIIRNCIPCRRQLAVPKRPDEGLLPSMRVPPPGQAVAFSVAAVDCAGPYRVKRGRSYELYYLLLITCCQIRAVRL